MPALASTEENYDWKHPLALASRAGLLDAIPNAMARTAGAARLMRSALSKEELPIAPTPSEVLCQVGSSRVLKYHRDTEPTTKEPVILVPSLINRAFILDLTHGLSVVEALIADGYAVYKIDWGAPGKGEAGMDLAAYVLDRLSPFVEAICADAGMKKAHVLGQCLGGTLTTILGAIDDTHIASLINLTAPISFKDTGMLSAWSRAPFFDAVSFAEAFGDIPPWITQPSFQLLKPLSQSVKMLRLFQNLGKPRFLDMYEVMEAWVNDNIPIPKGFYIDLIETLYRKDGLMTGCVSLRGRPVVLEEVKVPVLTIAASEDHIVPVPSAMCGHDRFSSEDKEKVIIAGGHIGVVVGGRGRRILHKTLDTWMKARSHHTKDWDKKHSADPGDAVLDNDLQLPPGEA